MPYDPVPFKKTYDDVTDRMQAYKNTLKDPERIWFGHLMDGFLGEYAKWGDEHYANYKKEWSKLKGAVPNLIAGAYLHIAYDLPRVIADHWRTATDEPPDEFRSEQIYLAAGDEFEGAFRKAAKSYSQVGWKAGFGWFHQAVEYVFGPSNLYKVASLWVLNLRNVAWLHARRLRALEEEGASKREIAEKNMLKAVEAALRDAGESTLMFAQLPSPKLLTVVGSVLPFSWAAFADIEIQSIGWRLPPFCVFAEGRRSRRKISFRGLADWFIVTSTSP